MPPDRIYPPPRCTCTAGHECAADRDWRLGQQRHCVPASAVRKPPAPLSCPVVYATCTACQSLMVLRPRQRGRVRRGQSVYCGRRCQQAAQWQRGGWAQKRRGRGKKTG